MIMYTNCDSERNSYYLILTKGKVTMSNLTELTAQIIAARAAKKDMSTEELQQEMLMIYSFLKGVEEGNVQPAAPEQSAEETKPQKINFKKVFKDNEVICLICNRGFKALKRHLAVAHNLKPGEYRKQFDIPSKQPLVAKAYSDKWRQAANDRGQGEILARAREARAANKAVIPAVKIKEPAPAIKVKASAPAVKTRAAAPVVKEKAAVSAKVAKKK